MLSLAKYDGNYLIILNKIEFNIAPTLASLKIKPCKSVIYRVLSGVGGTTSMCLKSGSYIVFVVVFVVLYLFLQQNRTFNFRVVKILFKEKKRCF